MSRGLDHIVWPTRDLDGLAASFRQLGFTVGRRNRHPWGTVNHIVQFDGTFIELLGFAEDYRAPAANDPAFPFAGFCERALERREACAAMLVLRSDDARADAETLRRQGLGQGRTLPFSRAAQGPDGGDRTVAFTIAFADLPGLPSIGGFLCEQHRPENFWNAAAQRHANAALGVSGLELHGPDPEAHARSLRLFADDVPERAMPEVMLGDGGRIAVIGASRDREPAITAIEMSVADPRALAVFLRANEIAPLFDDDVVTVVSPILGETRLRFRKQPTPPASTGIQPAARTREAM